jgi:predicted nucleic acid-binding Zn ribbon protein
MSGRIKAFRVKLKLWEHQLNKHNLAHFPRPKSVEDIRSVFLLQETLQKWLQNLKIMEPEFMLFAFS